MESFKEHIVKVGSEYELKSKATGRNLGKYSSKAGALKRERQVEYFKHMDEGTIQPNGTDKIDPACVEVASKKKTDKEMEDEQQNESFTFDSAAMAKQELADAKNRKKRKRGKVANLLRKLGMREEVEQISERDDAYTRDYKSSVSGMGKHQSAAYHADGGANDEGWGNEHHKSKPRSMMDRPHTVHIGGKPWKKFSNGHQAHAAARTLKNKGKDAVAIAHHNEETEMKPTKSLREFIETVVEAKAASKAVNVDKVNAAGQAPHEEKWEAAKKPAVKKESFTADELLVALKEGLWPGTPEYKAKFENKAKQGGGSGVKKGSRYGGSLQKPDNDNDADDKPADKKNK